MSIDRVSVKKAIKNVASPFYDKKNIFYYFVLIFLSSIIGLFAPEKPQGQDVILFGILLMLACCLSFFINGFYTLALNNSIHRREGVFTNPISSLSQILLVALFSLLGSVIWMIVMFVVTSVFMIPLLIYKQYVLAFVIPTIPLLFLVTLYLGAFFNFSVTLEIQEWFNIRKAWKFMACATPFFLEFFAKSFFLGLCGTLLCAFILFVSSPILAFTTEPVTTGVNGILTFIFSMIWCIISVYTLDLTAQFIRRTIHHGKL